jgi:predicted  nucleic acid-binding Zn-ribbon protein
VTSTTISEAELGRTRRDLERAEKRLAEASDRLADCAGSPHEFERIRGVRDKAAGEVERLSLLLANLEQRVAAEQEQVKKNRKAALEREAAELESQIARLDQEGVKAAGRLVELVREIEVVRGRALEISRKLNPTAYGAAPEPIQLYQCLAGVLNVIRRACTFSRSPV